MRLLTPLLVLTSSLLSISASPLLGKRATDPPAGAVIVRATDTQSGEFSTVQAAIDSLDDTSESTIFIFPGKQKCLASQCLSRY